MENFLTLPSLSPDNVYSPASSRTMSRESDAIGMKNDTKPDIFPYSPTSPEVGQAHYSVERTQADVGESHQKRKGRKGHTKSRTGCLNCKKARIKCKENRPSCDYCSHRGFRCQWPGLQITQVNQDKKETCYHLQSATRNTLPQIPLPLFHSEAPVFTMHDFRLFNHFIQSAYPHHPVGNDSVWTHEIPSLASNYDFLLHSMLALSAQDLADTQPPCRELQQTALSYRIKAITSLNEAIGSPDSSSERGNAMLATCFVLLFQSVLLDDGLIEYMSFIRGVIAVCIHMGTNCFNFLFSNLLNQTEVIQEGLKDIELINPEFAHGACRSLEQFGFLVKNTREVEYFGHLLCAARDLFTSSSDAFGNLSKIYALFCYYMSHEEFSTFVDPSNEAGKLLQSHFAALQLIMTPITLREKQRSPTTPGDGVTVRWLTNLHSNIHPEYRKYYEWPLAIESAVLQGTLPLKFE